MFKRILSPFWRRVKPEPIVLYDGPPIRLGPGESVEFDVPTYFRRGGKPIEMAERIPGTGCDLFLCCPIGFRAAAGDGKTFHVHVLDDRAGEQHTETRARLAGL